MPTRLLAASIERVLVSKERPFTPPERVRLVSLAKVQASALKVIVSPEALPKVVLPVMLVLPLMVSPVPTMRSEEHTSELQSHVNLVCPFLLDKALPEDTLFRILPLPLALLFYRGPPRPH